MDAATAYTLRLAALRDYAARSIEDAKTSEDPGECLAEARAAYLRILEIEETRRSTDG